MIYITFKKKTLVKVVGTFPVNWDLKAASNSVSNPSISVPVHLMAVIYLLHNQQQTESGPAAVLVSGSDQSCISKGIYAGCWVGFCRRRHGTSPFYLFEVLHRSAC